MMFQMSEYFHHYPKPDEKKPRCKFCNVPMQPLKRLDKNYMAQKWRFKCPNCEIEFDEWI